MYLSKIPVFSPRFSEYNTIRCFGVGEGVNSKLALKFLTVCLLLFISIFFKNVYLFIRISLFSDLMLPHYIYTILN